MQVFDSIQTLLFIIILNVLWNDSLIQISLISSKYVMKIYQLVK